MDIYRLLFSLCFSCIFPPGGVRRPYHGFSQGDEYLHLMGKRELADNSVASMTIHHDYIETLSHDC